MILREIRELSRLSETFVGMVYLNGGFTDENYKAITEICRYLEKEIFLYRVEHYTPTLQLSK